MLPEGSDAPGAIHAQEVLHYELKLISTSAATGYFSCVPHPAPDLSAALEWIARRPCDCFLRNHVLRGLLDLPADDFAHWMRKILLCGDPVSRSLVTEARLLGGDRLPGDARLDRDVPAQASPLVHLRRQAMPHRELHRQWMAVFKPNMRQHAPLPDVESIPLPRPYDDAGLWMAKPSESLAQLFAAAGPRCEDDDRRPLQATIETALERLGALDLFETPETRHVSSLSPIAYLRKWRLGIDVRSGRNRYRLAGVQTSYGKGLSPEAARASYLMEIVERVSAFASIDGQHLPALKQAHALRWGTHAELTSRDLPVLDPNRMVLDVPYRGESLHWMEARDAAGNSLWIPAQAVFLFCNLDEAALFESLGSTGLASGNTLEEARFSGLLEILERDADGVMPFRPEDCFELTTDNPHLAPLFEAYRQQGIDIRFQDITTEFGVPCFRCFVTDADGGIVKGTGAHLDSRKAVMSALTETPYPFPSGPPSRPGLPGVPRRRFEDLPNYDTHDTRRNLAMVERLLKTSGYEPLYVDLTRSDLDLPVVRAFVPGLEWLADFDDCATIHPRLYANFLKKRPDRV